MVWTLANLRTNVLCLKKPTSKKVICEIKDRNEKHDAGKREHFAKLG